MKDNVFKENPCRSMSVDLQNEGDMCLKYIGLDHHVDVNELKSKTVIDCKSYVFIIQEDCLVSIQILKQYYKLSVCCVLG